MPINTAVSMWRCDCGVALKAVTQFDPDYPTQLSVACPECGTQRLINGSKLQWVEKDLGDLAG
jgi:hypothetical protein